MEDGGGIKVEGKGLNLMLIRFPLGNIMPFHPLFLIKKQSQPSSATFGMSKLDHGIKFLHPPTGLH